MLKNPAAYHYVRDAGILYEKIIATRMRVEVKVKRLPENILSVGQAASPDFS